MNPEKNKGMGVDQFLMGVLGTGSVFIPAAFGTITLDALDGTFNNHRLLDVYNPATDEGRIGYLKNEEIIAPEDRPYFSNETIGVSGNDIVELATVWGLEAALVTLLVFKVKGMMEKQAPQAS